MSKIPVDQLMAWAYEELRREKPDRARLWATIVLGAFGKKEALKVMAVASHLLGEKDKAASAYQQALAEFPGDLYLIAGYAELCLDMAQFDTAATYLKRAIEADPKAAHPAGARARLLVAQFKKKYPRA